MDQENKTISKTFVKSDNEAVLVCPECSAAKTISVKQFRDRQHLLRVKCQCKHSFKVQLEFRNHYRKKTKLSGTYELEQPAVGAGKIQVINLSLSGACFEVHSRHDIQIGQTGSLVFTLDNRKESVLFKKIKVKTVNGNLIGCEFLEDRAFTKELGFYLRT